MARETAAPISFPWIKQAGLPSRLIPEPMFCDCKPAQEANPPRYPLLRKIERGGGYYQYGIRFIVAAAYCFPHIMKPNQLTGILSAAAIAILAAGLAMGQDEESDDGGKKPEVAVDTLGMLSGHKLTLTTSTVHHWLPHGNEGYETEFSL